ncbi:anaerobic ribonucleoside-triphosphate reductase [Pontiella agarivorans]|uniref:Anaerobic ribonucleoside-triphosphate reductase n=1 Tax=Pontiella agarivorans TaxID=3038953 RepID=A0ABU5MV44_9BACT|nr:anaerobic ribonucleoside-triphosphate reductase [Pontiella agarivorans]MDZ8118099.1 anaerobic ribonucleoside-triphosphate reductase [Pontiella agarivorans]
MPGERPNTAFDGFQKRSGLIVPFSGQKIERAIDRAVEDVARKQGSEKNEGLDSKTADLVLQQLNNPNSEFYVHADENGKRIPKIEDVQDLVEITLAEQGETLVVATYKRYRKQREIARRNIRVRGTDSAAVDVTDAALLLVESSSKNVNLPWDRKRIVKQILDKTDLSVEVAINVAKAVENRIIGGDMTIISTALIRELVNNELTERGYAQQLRDLSLYRVSKDYLENLMFTKSTENSNIVNNNPEAVNLGIAELVLKQWALDTIFSPDVKRAHDTGAIHVHDLGYPTRVYCSSHSIEYVKKYGLNGLINLNTSSDPARSASVLTGHLNTFLASMQANYAGALGIAYINILYAPFLVGMDAQQLKQVAQELIFNGSQNAFSRGGQTLFLDFNIHTGVPSYMKTVPAIGPGGRYQLRLQDGSIAELTEELREETDAGGNRLMDLYYEDPNLGKRLVLREITDESEGTIYDPDVAAMLAENGEAIVTYGDYTQETQDFCRALLQVFAEGDAHGRIFEFPKCDFHVSDETYEDPAQFEIFKEACELASKNGSTYFIFDRDEVTLSACCRLRTTIDDNRMLKHPESMRFCGFQNVTINIPQASYRAARTGGNIVQNFYAEIDRTMELAVDAHLQKKRKAAEMLSGPGHPLWQIGKTANDGKPYVDLENCTYILGLIGVNDAVRFLIGQELHESREAQRFGLKIVAHMYRKAKKLAAKHNLKFTLEESPAESAARRLAKSDLVYFPEEAADIVKGPEDAEYYTNSIHLAAEADVSLVDRITEQAKYHSMIESGAITHCFIGEERPNAESIAHLMTEVFYRTQSAQVCISPEFTFCNHCQHQTRGLLEQCPECGSTDVVGETRVVGYFSKIQNWNKSKRYGELLARHAGKYNIVEAGDNEMVTV